MSNKKIRIQLMDSEGRILSDKLSEQDPTLSLGPKDIHEGPMRIEFTFFDKKDIEKVNKFLDQITGKLPLSKKPTASKNDQVVEMDESKRESLIMEAVSQKNQDAFISYLRNLGFTFMYNDFMEIMEIPFDPKKAHKNKYQWMVRKTKESKTSPLTDKYDPTIIFGVKIDMGIERSEKVVCYLYNKFHSSSKLKLVESPEFGYENTNLIKYPKYMTYDERIKFAAEHRGLTSGSRKEPSKFYKRWLPYVIIPNDSKTKFDKDAGKDL